MTESRDDSRDILIELRADVRLLRQTVETFRRESRESDISQWKQLNVQGEKIEGQERSISFLTRGFWIGIAVSLGGIGGLFFWVVKKAAAQ